MNSTIIFVISAVFLLCFQIIWYRSSQVSIKSFHSILILAANRDERLDPSWPAQLEIPGSFHLISTKVRLVYQIMCPITLNPGRREPLNWCTSHSRVLGASPVQYGLSWYISSLPLSHQVHFLCRSFFNSIINELNFLFVSATKFIYLAVVAWISRQPCSAEGRKSTSYRQARSAP